MVVCFWKPKAVRVGLGSFETAAMSAYNLCSSVDSPYPLTTGVGVVIQTLRDRVVSDFVVTFDYRLCADLYMYSSLTVYTDSDGSEYSFTLLAEIVNGRVAPVSIRVDKESDGFGEVVADLCA